MRRNVGTGLQFCPQRFSRYQVRIFSGCILDIEGGDS